MVLGAGTVTSTFFVGFATNFIGRLGWIDIGDDLFEALMFGALISSIDPVATLSILGNPELRCDTVLYSIVFGESVLNDAVSISLFRVFSRGRSTSANPGGVFVEFMLMSGGSCLVGVVIGLGSAFIFKHSTIRSIPMYESTLLYIIAYTSYALSEVTSCLHK